MKTAEGLKRVRLLLGLSQADLASAAGLSRALVSAVETGRHTPSVDAALALAGALGVAVEDLFTPAPVQERPIFGAPLDGAPVLAARVGDVLVYDAVPEQGVAGPHWRAPDGVVRDGRIKLFDRPRPDGFVVAGCDPALGLAAGLLPDRGPARLLAVAASSAAARDALERGVVHAIVVHGTGPSPSSGAPASRRVHLARWEVGLAALPQMPLELGRSESVAVARRDPGAESQQALERARAAAGGGMRPLRGPVVAGHLEAARLVALGVAELGVTMRPAAMAFGLSFLGLEEHDVQLWVADQWWDHPGAQALIEVIASGGFRRRLEHLGGYDLAGAGEPVA
ncbi:MAG: helix-turn-helix domain-containing protein [Actinobacteria bacterium]|nr:helix-turn-helix domain-containing protein [Actinomycetota bacterium]